jgi:protein TonB
VHHRVAVSKPQPAPAPAEAPPPKAAPAHPSPPVFGIAMDSPTDATSAIAAPVGGSAAADPSRPGRRGPAQPAAPGEGPPGEGAPVSELEVAKMPDIDTDACGKTITYPADAQKNGIQGDVRLRVALDERGHVRNARVLAGLGHGLDQAATDALTHRCHFSPAISKSGKPVAFVVQSYTFHFELPR